MTTFHNDSLQEKTCLIFDYQMLMTYQEEVTKEFYTIKALPCCDQRQTVLDCTPEISPNTDFIYSQDGFGNKYLYGSLQQCHNSFEYHVKGKIEISQILFEDYATEEEIYLFRHPFRLNKSGEGLRKYFNSLTKELEENDYVNAIYLMHRLHQDYLYCKGATYVSTPAEEAWNIGSGVCQDYAHIFIALCQLAHIPARYVTGITLGEGESHAWVEILYKGRWIGMDPTNDLLVSRAHIKFSHGRDALDCTLNRGILYGGGAQIQKILVNVHTEQ